MQKKTVSVNSLKMLLRNLDYIIYVCYVYWHRGYFISKMIVLYLNLATSPKKSQNFLFDYLMDRIYIIYIIYDQSHLFLIICYVCIYALGNISSLGFKKKIIIDYRLL